MKTISPVLILAKKAEIFNKSLNLSWDKTKLVFNKQEIIQLRNWFEKNISKLKKAYQVNIFWKNNILILEKDLHLPPLELLKRLEDFHYIKSRHINLPGEYAHRGEIVDIFPINLSQPIRIEFLGNTIERIYYLEKEDLDIETFDKKLKLPKTALDHLTSGDYIVHLDHGIGRFAGFLVRQKKRYYEIHYKGDDVLLVPENLKEKLSPYLGFTKPSLNRLGSGNWIKTKKKVKKYALKFAKELLEIYAKREISHRLPYNEFPDFESRLDAAFEYELTKDQKNVWKEINKDFVSSKPMDRLICGDVGFGKTEIAMRTAFRTALNNYQTAVICPTTILADQHFLTFSSRLENFPVKTAILTRLVPKHRQGKIIKDLKNGKIDILIGTHRILSQDVIFKNLGLLIIDEEQRFGVKQKERLKKMEDNINILSLSATPIPRTLHMALSQLKDISLIQTPPVYKLPIKTKIAIFNEALIKKAIQKEISRQGQVYYLHNRIGTLIAVKQKLQELIPEASFAVLHGRMSEAKLIKTIHQFRDKKYDVLIATSIIENGLDLKNVNTLIIEDATKLGLSQAHQIRGRVGRGNLQSFAFFLYPHHNLNHQTKERLVALEKFSYLGAGYQIASKDLEIRGAGNLLGREQSGSINKVGLNLYYQILNQAIEYLKKNKNLDI
jgi:transcription-repair coupling factor (superfamily II helicase)